MKFCKNCGTELDGRQFCPNCGTKADTESAAPIPKKNKKSKTVLFVIIAIVLLIAVAGTVVGVVAFKPEDKEPEAVSEGRSYDDVIDKYVESVKTLDAEKMIDLLPEELMNYHIEEEDFGSKDGYITYLQRVMDNSLKDLSRTFGNDTGAEIDLDITDIEIKYEILSVEDVSEDRLRMIKSYCINQGITPEAAKEIWIDFTAECSGESYPKNTWIEVVKIDDSWYLFSE